MGMSGGGGGAASPSLEERGQMYLMANPGASRADAYKAAQSGLSPLQYDNYTIGRKMVQGDPKLGDPGARVDVKRYGLQMSNLAQGGLMVRGLGQLRDTLDAPAARMTCKPDWRRCRPGALRQRKTRMPESRRRSITTLPPTRPWGR